MRFAGLLVIVLALLLPRHADTRGVLQPAHFVAELPNSNSEALDVFKVLSQLLNRGHRGTLVTVETLLPFWRLLLREELHLENSQDTPNPNPTTSSSSSSRDETALERLAFITYPDMPQQPRRPPDVHAMQPKQLMEFMQQALILRCNHSLNSPGVRQQLAQLQPPPTAVLINSPSPVAACGCLYGTILNISILGLNGNPQVNRPWAAPQFMSGLTPKDLDTWSGLVANTWAWLKIRLMRGSMTYAPWRPLWQQHVPQSGTASSQVTAACRPLVTLRLLGRDLEFPQAFPASEVLVGSSSPEFPQPLSPPEVLEFVQGAIKGLIFVSFGSTRLYSGLLGREDYRRMGTAWHQLNQLGYRVLWVLRDQGLPEGVEVADLKAGPDTMVVSWVQQNNLLAHPNTKALVSAGGVHSVYEAAFHGVPLVALPFTKEQLGNAQLAEWKGFGLISPQALVFMRKGLRRCSGTPAAAAAAGGSIAGSSAQADGTTAAQGAATGAQGASGGEGQCNSGAAGEAATAGSCSAGTDQAAASSAAAATEKGCQVFQVEELVKDVLKVMSEREGYPAAAQRMKGVLQYRAAIRAPLQLAADELEAILLREGLVEPLEVSAEEETEVAAA